MSIHDLKIRLADVPGIETLTLTLIGGRQVFGFNGLIAAVDPMATDQEIDTAIRDAAALGSERRRAIIANRLAYVSPFPDKEEKPLSVPSPTGFKPGEISSLFKTLRARKEAMIADIQASGAEVANILAAGEQMAAGLKADADALKAELGQLTNFPPE